MNVSRYLEHWAIAENPFKAEEARHDAIFARMQDGHATHPDFEKILGDLSQPAASIVFGEKGAGKTAIRLQIARRIEHHNLQHPDRKALLIAYDDLNPMLDRFCGRAREEDDDDGLETLKRLKSFRLSDHLDGILHTAVPRLLDAALDASSPEAAWRTLRKASPRAKRSIQLLQALYDRHEGYEHRAALLRRRLRVPLNTHRIAWKGLAAWGWLPAAAIAVASFIVRRDLVAPMVWMWALYAGLALWGLLLANWFVAERILVIRRTARRVAKRLRVVGRPADALARVLEYLPPSDRAAHILPRDDREERRYALMARLREVIEPLGYRGVIIIVDRVDEPTVISGDAERMRALVWPMLANKFLQQECVGVKLLLPVELRHELFRESGAFFQGARLDKQNLVERLTWSGPALYDLCSSRLAACRPSAAAPITLADLFDDEVTRQDLIDALEQMHQPRDAFKLIYQCIQEHCSNVTEDQQKWRIPRPVLDSVRKQQAERVTMLHRGYRPA
jgi:hypothetical protein